MSAPGIFGNLFLSIGAMKAGTTWLYTVLDCHPELHFSPEKEIHYFYSRYVDAAILSERRRLENVRNRYLFRFNPENANIDRIRHNLHWVAAYLGRPVDDFWFRNLFHLRPHQKYACDFSNLNALLPGEAWPQIEAQCERLRVLYTMRDPLKRLWSHTKFHLEFSGQADKLDTWRAEDFDVFVRKPFIWDNAEYGRILGRLRRGLRQENWMGLFYEDLHTDQRGKLKEIEDFLGISHYSYPDAIMKRRVNKSIRRPMPEFFPELFARDIARIKGEVEAEGFAIPESWG